VVAIVVPERDLGPVAPPAVTVVIVTYNSARVVAACLESLPAALGSMPYRVVVADNASADETLSIVRAVTPAAIIVETGRNGGYAAGINAALAVPGPTGPALVLNPDVRLAPDAVPLLLSALESPRCGIAVPLITDPDGRMRFSLRRDPSLLRALGEAVLGGLRAGRFKAFGEIIVDSAQYATQREVDWATGAVMLISADCQAAVGPWDETFFLYSEETDFSIRSRRAGFTLRYVPSAQAVHIGGEAKTSAELRAILVRSRMRLYRKHHGRAAAGAFCGAVLANELVRALAGRRENTSTLRSLVHDRRWLASAQVDRVVAAGAR